MARYDRDAQPESAYAWWRLAASLAIMTVSGVGMYAGSVALPAIQAEFGIDRASASLPYTVHMIGFGLGGIVMGRLADRFGAMVPVMVGGVALAIGFFLAGNAASLWQFNLAMGLLVGLFGTAAGYAPLIADTSLWFDRRRGIAVAICASGNYVAGSLWPPVLQYLFETGGWRSAFMTVGGICFLALIPLALVLRRAPPSAGAASAGAGPAGIGTIDLDARMLILLLCIASVSSCVAMAMPQVHIVAYCVDLGFGLAKGAQMLSLMLGFGIVSRVFFGWVCDRIGGLRTLLLGSFLQGTALLAFLPFDSLSSLYVVSAMFGFFQGGIVPAYAIIVREYFPASQAGSKVGLAMMSSQAGMAIGGWMSGAVFDLTGSYTAAFVNGIGWNLLNFTIVAFLLRRALRGAPAAAPA